MDESKKLSELYIKRDNLYSTLHDISHEVGEKKVISDEMTKELYKTIGAIEFLEQQGIRPSEG